MIGALVALYRRKDRYHSPDLEFVKTMLGLLHANTLALRRDGDLTFVLSFVLYVTRAYT